MNVRVERLQQLERLKPTVVSALERAGSTLSEMSCVQIEVSSSTLDLVRLVDVPATDGSPEALAVGVYVAMLGEGRGHLLLLMDEPVACQLASLLMGEDPAGITMANEMAISALAEAGNVSCSAFMNVLGDATGLRIEVSPPAVLADMRGAIVDAIVADIALLGDEALVIGTHFARPGDCSGASAALDVRLLVIPTPETLGELLRRAGAMGASHS